MDADHTDPRSTASHNRVQRHRGKNGNGNGTGAEENKDSQSPAKSPDSLGRRSILGADESRGSRRERHQQSGEATTTPGSGRDEDLNTSRSPAPLPQPPQPRSPILSGPTHGQGHAMDTPPSGTQVTRHPLSSPLSLDSVIATEGGGLRETSPDASSRDSVALAAGRSSFSFPAAYAGTSPASRVHSFPRTSDRVQYINARKTATSATSPAGQSPTSSSASSSRSPFRENSPGRFVISTSTSYASSRGSEGAPHTLTRSSFPVSTFGAPSTLVGAASSATEVTPRENTLDSARGPVRRALKMTPPQEESGSWDTVAIGSRAGTEEGQAMDEALASTRTTATRAGKPAANPTISVPTKNAPEKPPRAAQEARKKDDRIRSPSAAAVDSSGAGAFPVSEVAPPPRGRATKASGPPVRPLLPLHRQAYAGPSPSSIRSSMSAWEGGLDASESSDDSPTPVAASRDAEASLEISADPAAGTVLSAAGEAGAAAAAAGRAAESGVPRDARADLLDGKRRPSRTYVLPCDEENDDAPGRDREEFVLSRDVTSVEDAINTGVPEAVPAVLAVIPPEQAVQELTALRTNAGDGRLETLVMLAALSGDMDMFNAVLRAMRKVLAEEQVANVIEAREDLGVSLLSAAAEGGGSEVFEATLELLGGKAEAVSSMQAQEAGYLIKMAAKSGQVKVFETVTDMFMLDGQISIGSVMGSAMQPGEGQMSTLMHAAASGSGAMVEFVTVTMFELLTTELLVASIVARGARRMTVFTFAVISEKVEAVRAVVATLALLTSHRIAGDPPPQAAPASSKAGSRNRRSTATHNKRNSTSRNAINAPQDSKFHVRQKVRDVVMAKDIQGMTALMHAARSADIDIVEAVNEALPKFLSARQVRETMTAKDVQGMTALTHACKGENLHIVEAVADAMSKYLSPVQLIDAYTASFAACCTNFDEEIDDRRMAAMSLLLKHGARPSNKGLIHMSTTVKYLRMKECLLGAVSSAKNPFIPGMNLSVALSVAAKRALEGERRALNTMQAAVDELLLEVLEHLPQTVRGFKGEMKACSAVFEPEAVIASHRGVDGPLSVALLKRQQMEKYCTIPLVLDFMGRKFSKGLPSIMDREGVLETDRTITDPERLLGDGLLAEGRVLFLGMTLQRGYGDRKLSSITYFPGARFIIAGMLSSPMGYYKVPALRMVLDLVTYVIMMILFASSVLLHDSGTVDWTEIIFSVYIFAAITTELREIMTDLWEYMRDKWNVLDVTSLTLLIVGFGFRFRGDDTADVSRNLYALAAPLAFSRILFFAQILPSQGPMIQVIFAMTGELVKFGVVMLVVMAGFVMSFYSLFRDTQTYGEVWLSVFKAMLGETDYFEDFAETPYNVVANMLLATYLVILTIMMLNLLVAVLSTAHSAIQENADREYKVSKARLIQHYVHRVETDSLPPPFNLVQMVCTFPFLIVDAICDCVTSRAPATTDAGESAASAASVALDKLKHPNKHPRTTLHSRARRFFGRVVFWGMLGPVAVLGGCTLWTLSVVKAPRVVWRTSADKGLGGRILRSLLAILCCVLLAPLYLLLLWLKGGLSGLTSLARFCGPCCGEKPRRRSSIAEGVGVDIASTSDGDAPTDRTRSTSAVDDEAEDVVVTMLRDAEGGLQAPELQQYLDDPMSDPDVRRDEETRATTVEHIKLLRNRLEATTREHVEELQAYFVRATDVLSRQLGAGADTKETRDSCSSGGDREVRNSCEKVVEQRGSGVSDGRRASSGKRVARQGPEGVNKSVEMRLSELEDRLARKSASLEDRIAKMMDEKMAALALKVGALVNKTSE